MAVASLRYDHPAYTVPVVFSGSTTAGPNGVTTKFCAFTAMKLKQVVNAPNLALPTTAAGLEAAAVLIGEGRRVNMTLVFSQSQAA